MKKISETFKDMLYDTIQSEVKNFNFANLKSNDIESVKSSIVEVLFSAILALLHDHELNSKNYKVDILDGEQLTTEGDIGIMDEED